SGVLLALGAFLLACWLLAAAGSAEGFAAFQQFSASVFGQVALFAFSAALVYHFLNGIRHLFWDMGWGFEIPKAYASGYAVLALAVIFTAVLWYVGLRAGGVL
ncbi:MAG TPA: succinate dehydrogenase, cytochrome b556 subunit, partial [Arenimonas sp.]|nr:succinate dehydrogenase, cytochrome b556 subunit [Arenimonas sp.]